MAWAVSQHTDTMQQEYQSLIRLSQYINTMQQKHQGLGCATTHWPCSKNTNAWAVSQHTDHAARIPMLGLRHNTLTPRSKNTKAWAVSQHIDTMQQEY